MSEMTWKERAGGFLASSKVKLVGLAAAGMGLVSSVSADVDLNATIGPIIDSVTALIPSLINLIVALLPAIIAMAVIGLIIGIFEGIINKLKF